MTWSSEPSSASSSWTPHVPGPLVGWRAWRVTAEPAGTRLRSAVFDELWEPGRPLAAACTREHRAPAAECACGVYAVRAPADAVRYLVGRDGPEAVHRILGEAALWGVTVEGENGWRAEYATPVRLVVPAARTNGWPVAAAAIAAELAAAYGIAAEVVEAAEPARLVTALAA